MTQQGFRRFNLWFVGGAGACFALALAFLLAVDVFGLFGTRLLSERHLPSGQRMGTSGDRVLKAIEIARLPPGTTLVLGSSRALLGIDPGSPTLAGTSLYNGALLMGGMAEAALVGGYALEQANPPRRIIWALDHDLFFTERNRATDFERSAFAGVPVTEGLRRHLVSLHALFVSWEAARRFERGAKASATTAGWSRRSAIAAAYPADWDRTYRDEFESARETILNSTGPSAAERDTAYRGFEAALGDWLARGVEVELVINPRYVWRLAAMTELNAFDRIEDWKRQVLAIATRVSRTAGRPVRVVDFDVAAPVAAEPVPPGVAAAQDGPRGFLETSHYRPPVGDAMLAQVLNLEGPSDGIAPFGVDLAGVDLEAHLAAIRARVARWQRDAPEPAAYVAERTAAWAPATARAVSSAQ